MEIHCINNCGNLTESPDSPECLVCQELGDQRKKYTITWQSGKKEKMKLTPYQADNLKQTAFVLSVELVK